ncbi:ABC transporter ATP-binding protein [Erysipelotrichaceae bacterium AF15-26LB]|nr:ABC transporter, ATP-binding protein [Erysipelotrichaceae bacterium 3_1_53]MCR0349439.1 ABC transporter ATP-binding protein [[Clostridium] innocuum]RJV85364.1 ABC transporter ATP-binding protein [Erysipelotrichaceae bacterium AF15-26LB]RJV86554.1 ABC transporter ATP-binding protein [Erysipelotrichaceae bacterium AF19-24AC]
MSVIEVSHLTKDYGYGRGVFDVSAHVDEGECYGFLGPNGAGKSTTIRHLMGFSKPQSGTTVIDGRNSWKYAAELQRMVGYLPGEIAFPTGMSGAQFLKMQMQMRGLLDDTYLQKLLKKFELDPHIGLKQMSLGTRRKLAVVTAFLHDPAILILDEPTSGLDPIMQEIFIDYILDEKKRGKTIFLSSHIFHEVDALCDRIAIIRDGKIVSEFDPEVLKRESDKIYRVSFDDEAQWREFTTHNYKFTSINKYKLRARIQLKNCDIPSFLADISNFHIKDFTEFPFSLEDYFMQFYHEDKVFEGVK